MRIVRVEDQNRDSILGEQVEVASSSLTRMVGLLGRDHLDDGSGLWIKPSSGVHTVGMKFTIDVVGLDNRLRVVKLWKRLPPNRLTAVSFKMSSVIELPAGRIDQCSIELGDTLTISE